MTPKNNELLFCALGGSGEIGMNVILYGHAGKWLMVDCGVTFADDNILWGFVWLRHLILHTFLSPVDQIRKNHDRR